MADTPTKPPKAKRIVKNPETFRERAIKATIEGDKAPRFTWLKKILKAPFRALRRFGQALAGFPAFKPLRKPLRILGLIVFPVYFRNSWRELKLVTWPSFKQSLKLTWAVLLFAIVFGTSVALVDYGLNAVFKRLLLK